MKKKHKRCSVLLLALILFSCVITIVCTTLQDNISFFYSPTELLSKNIASDKMIRIGGVVKADTIVKSTEYINFVITDYHQSVPVIYTRKVLPNLFKENKGIIAEGYFRGGKFFSSELLIKHNENYQPPIK